MAKGNLTLDPGFEEVHDLDPGFEEISAEPSFGQKVMGGIAKASQFMDSYTGAPVRKGIGALQEGGSLGEALSAGYEQFGKNPLLAPTDEDIAVKAGVPTTGRIPMPAPIEALSLLTRGKPTEITPAEAAGFGIGVVADLTNLIPGIAQTKAGAKAITTGARGAVEAIPKLLKGAEKTALLAEKPVIGLGKKAMSGTFGVSQDAIKNYLERLPEAKGLKADREAIGALKEKIDATLMPLTQRVEDAKLAVENAKDLKASNVTELQRELDTASNALEIAKQRALGEGGATVSGKVKTIADRATKGSQEARDLLDEAGITVKTPSIKGNLTRAIKAVEKEAVTDQKVALADLLRRYRERMNRIGKEIPGSQAKTLIQDLDREMQLVAPGAVGKNSPADLALLDLRRDIDRPLKEYQPYREKMAQVAADTRKLKKLTGLEEEGKAVSALTRTKSPAGVDIERVLQEIGVQPSKYTDPTRLPEYARIKGLESALSTARAGAGVEAAQGALKGAKRELGPFSTIAPNEFGQSSVESSIRNQMRPNTASLETEKTFKALDEKMGTKFSEDLKNLKTVAPFEKEFTQGSANTNFFSILGGGMGGLLGSVGGVGGTVAGATTGAMAGAKFGKLVVDKYGPKVARQILDKTPELQKMRPSEWIKRLDVPKSVQDDLAGQLSQFLSAGAMATPAAMAIGRSGEKEKLLAPYRENPALINSIRDHKLRALILNEMEK